jgi:hypothetical protein
MEKWVFIIVLQRNSSRLWVGVWLKKRRACWTIETASFLREDDEASEVQDEMNLVRRLGLFWSEFLRMKACILRSVVKGLFFD